jgi:hypothetical protein
MARRGSWLRTVAGGLRSAFGAAFLVVALTAAAAARPSTETQLWRALDWFEGRWEGTERGVAGEGRAVRCTGPLFGGRFRFLWTVAELAPEGSTPEETRYERWQVIGRHPVTGAIVLEQFDSAGFRSEYRLDPTASRADRFVFRAVELDTAPEGMDGRIVLAVRGADRYHETLELGPVDAGLQEVSSLRWRRVEGGSPDCSTSRPRLRGPFD